MYNDDIQKVKDLVDNKDFLDAGNMREARVSKIVVESIIKYALKDLKVPVEEFVEHGCTFKLNRKGLPGNWKDFDDLCIDDKLEPTIAGVSIEGSKIDISIFSQGKILNCKFEEDDIFANLYSVLSEFNAVEVVFDNAKLERPLCSMGMIVHFYKIKEKGSIELLKSYLGYDNLKVEEITRTGIMVVDNNMHKSLSIDSIMKLFLLYTNQGKRLFHKFVKSPLKNEEEIKRRQSHVAAFKDLDMRILNKFPDMIRISKMINNKRASLETLLRLSQVIKIVPDLITQLNASNIADPSFQNINEDFVMPLESLNKNLTPLVLEIENTIDEDGHIHGEFSTELSKMYKEIEEMNREIELEHERVMSIHSRIKLDKTRVFKLSRNDYNLFEEDFKKSKFLEVGFGKNGISFITQTLSELNEKIAMKGIEISEAEKAIKDRLVGFSSNFIPLIEALNYLIAYIDILNSFSQKINEGWTRPIFTVKFHLKNAFHPMIRVNAIKNDIMILDKRFVTITGPNMGGKSTFLKMCGVVVLLAQIGSFVPAEHCETPLFDSIMVRIGANDCASKGISTFMAEMMDISKICHKSTSNTLVLIDELGRGTGELDGVSLALAIKEFLIEVNCITLFATHFPQVCGEDTLNKKVGSKGCILSYLIEDGICSSSFGIEVAEKIGFPQEIIENAKIYGNVLSK